MLTRVLRPVIILAVSLALLLCAGTPAPLRAAQPPWTKVVENADFVVSEERLPPAETAEWLPVSLPDEWRHRMPPDFHGYGWYRIKFFLPRDPDAGFALHSRHRRAYRLDFFVNGKFLASTSDLAAKGGSRATEARMDSLPINTSEFLLLPPSLLNPGENVVHIRMRGTAASYALHGLGRLTLGDARPVRKAYILDLELGLWAQRTFLAMGLATGMITLFLWLARRNDRVMLWFTITLLAWAVVGIPRVFLRYMDSPVLLSLVATYINYGLVVPAVVLCLRTADLRWSRFEAVLWVYFIATLSHPLWPVAGNAFLRLGWDAMNAAILMGGVAIILRAARKPLRWPVLLEVVALVLMAVLMLSEIARYLGWIDVEVPVVRHYHVPVMLLAIGAAVFERHVLAVWRVEQSNIELERRVTEKAREIEAYHAERAEVLRQHALARERQRIITDMHDGLGASLVGLLRYVEMRQGDAQIEQRVKEALQELRIAIDALEPSEGDLGSVLGNLRYRLEPLLEPAGVRLDWDVAELPRVKALEPSAVFALQRIILEAVANALKHSGATRIRLAARALATGEIEIHVEDDGRGFDSSLPAVGVGLTSMRARAARIGARIEITSDAGTAVRLVIPPALPGSSDTQQGESLESYRLDRLAPAPGAA